MATLNLQTTSSILGKTTTVSLATTSATSLLSNAYESGFVYKVRSIIVANASTSSAADITVAYYSAAALGGVAYPIVSTVSIPASSTLPILDSNTFIYMPDDSSLGITAGTSNTLTVTCAYEQVTADELPAPPPPPGPTPAGLWSWGQNTNGQLGLNDRVARSSPVQVGALTNWYVPIGIGNHLVLTDVSKKLWSCGANTNGNLGQNDTVNRSSPTQVGADTTWSNKTVSGGSATFSIKTDGTLWSWGLNSSGQLGQNNAINRSSPVQVGALTNWGYIHSTGSSVMSVKTDGTLWSWGFNGSGQLGQNDIIDRSSPVQVGSDTNWSKCKINSVISIVSKANGTLWACGNGAYGRTGLGIATSNSSPIQIGSDTNWSKISISTDGSANYGGFAIKTTGAMWVWGRNNYGSLGLNNVNPQSTPIQLGLLTNWSKVSAGDNAVMAIKTDGSLWAIGGRNQLGQLGLNDTINRSSPVQVGAGTTWQDISGGSSRFSGTKA